MLVLTGNIPRFSWEPSATMLSNRLSGTTGSTVSNRTGRPIVTDLVKRRSQRELDRPRTQSSLATANPERALCCCQAF
jgi:hypothetical protein